MVLAINSNEQSAKNFSAFQTLAMQQNGTASNTTGSSNTTGTSGGSSSGAFAVRGSMGAVVGIVGALFAILL